MTAVLAVLAAAALILWTEAHLGGGRWTGTWAIPAPWRRHGKHRRGHW